MVNGIRYATPQHSLHSRYVKNTTKYIEPVGVFIGDDHMKRKAGYLVGPDHDIKVIGGGWRSDAMVMVVVLVWRWDENRKNKIVCQNRRETSFENGDFERGFSTILAYDFIFTIL
jgi:hypothetical protein